MSKQKRSLAPLAQTLVVIFLFLVFLKLFAWDAVGRYARDEVMIKVEMEEAETLNSPAVTVCMDLVSHSL